MRYLTIVLLLTASMNAQTVFNFQKDATITNWYIVNDGVMGGLSQGTIALNKDGHGIFSGNISLENYGGFSSVRYRLPEPMKATKTSKIILKLKGDGKKYQFRVRDDYGKRYSYTTMLATNGDWQEITITLGDLYPTFRGRILDLPNFNGDFIEELTILAGNKKAESFTLLIDSIRLEHLK